VYDFLQGKNIELQAISLMTLAFIEDCCSFLPHTRRKVPTIGCPGVSCEEVLK
jgi:hypothetical protein